MARFNDSYLKPALDGLKESAGSILDNANSITDRINAESDAVRNKSQADLSFKRNVSVGCKVILILTGVGILAILLAWGAAIVIDALRKESISTAKLGTLQNQVEVYGSEVKILSSKLGSSTLASKSEIDEYFTSSSKALEELKGITRKLATDMKNFSTGSEKSELSSGAETPPIIGYSVTKFELKSTSERCFDNGSYEKQCDDAVEFPNGSTYSGFWKNGQPDSNGKLTFTDGSYLDGIWQQGSLIKIEKEEKIEQTALKSVTYFQSVSAKGINSRFIDITVGYNFDTGADKTWKSAFCYLIIQADDGDLRVDLSRIPSFKSKIIDYNYSYSSLHSKGEFEASQKKCEYKYLGFN